LSQLEKVDMNHRDVEDSFLTVAEVAETLKLNQQTVRNWIDQGSLPAVRVGRRVRIRRSDFDRLLAESYTAGAATAAAGPSAEDFWGGEAVGVPEAPTDSPAAEAGPSVQLTT
jgi:excisionase family DNA binding protein